MKKTLTLVFILLFPSLIYIYLVAGKEKSFVRMEYFGPKQVLHLVIQGKSKTDTAFYQVPAFALSSQTGQKINSVFFRGNIWVGYFAHLKDASKSDPMAVLMNRVEERTDLDTALKLVTFDADSENATDLQAYATKIHAGKKRYFLSGSPAEVDKLAIDGFYKPVDSSYTNGYCQFFLVDKESHIRGIYNGNKVKDIDKLIDDISILEAAYFVQKEIEQEKEGKGGDHDGI